MDRAIGERLINSTAQIITWPWFYHFQCLQVAEPYGITLLAASSHLKTPKVEELLKGHMSVLCSEDTCLQCPHSSPHHGLFASPQHRDISLPVCSSALRYEIINLLLTHPMRGLSGQVLFLERFGSRKDDLNTAGEAVEQNGSQSAKEMLRRTWISGEPAPALGERQQAEFEGKEAIGGDGKARKGRRHWGFWGSLVLRFHLLS